MDVVYALFHAEYVFGLVHTLVSRQNLLEASNTLR